MELNNEQTKQKLDMLEKIYEARELDFEEMDKKDRAILRKLSHGISIEEIEEKLKENLEKVDRGNNLKTDIMEQIELLAENYEIQIAYYCQKNYKRGFKDALCLYTQCLKEDNL